MSIYTKQRKRIYEFRYEHNHGHERRPLIRGEIIWDRPDPRLRPELCDLIRFRDHWYCGFREAEIHYSHPSGRGRVIRSADGKHWHTVAVFDWDGRLWVSHVETRFPDRIDRPGDERIIRLAHLDIE